MNEKIQNAIKLFISEVKKDQNNFTPIYIDITKHYESRLMEILVSEIGNDIENVIIKNKKLLENIRLHDIIRSFNFTLKNCLNNQKELHEFRELLYQNSGVLLLDDELDLALKDPEIIVKSKIDYKSESEIQKLYTSRLSSYDYTEVNNDIYNNNKKAFIISVIVLTNEINKIFNPIEFIANEYEYLKEHYETKGIDLTTHPEFSSYKLISICDDYELMECYPPRIYDKNIDLTIFLNGIEDYVYKYLIEMSKKHEFKLSLKPSSLFFINGRYNLVKLYEHLETGKYFETSNFSSRLLTKLYNESYDNLWVKIEDTDLTFEETLKDFEIYNDTIVTQVVHSQFLVENEILFITHLDHEFIFYTLEEFENRQNDATQKGEARKRIKTFKIDDAKIPINADENILFQILEMKFKNKDLINEYFNKIE